MSEEKRGDNADEIIRLREALYDQERQTGRWVTEAASQERRADEIQQFLGRELQSASRTIERLMQANTRLRELLDEIGVMAANAPEDGDSFGLLEEIAMRIGIGGVPDSACGTCDGSGMLTVPDGDGESASEQACPDPVHAAQPAPDLRALLGKATSLLWDTGMPGSRQAAGELRASGGLEALT